ncbi:MAG: RND transporter [Pseudomonadales bacterium]|jgi:uncharacterized protein|nr:RND transporter [Pseudomonadales bacterium]MAQ24627.1 RND transporter [Pseudomonadales bacterium]TNC89904.1 MAG: RND transporter [Alcanivorax sp.]HAG96294.1 RND transporter [Gammaproteobacteria bacterium]HAU14360.1 RND transporter [Gammaproteobacteria bacterium]|tara:strand:+ start:28801 stop:31161 length:2361 start_codon:yes stop_codon:yes gene_type:complete
MADNQGINMTESMPRVSFPLHRPRLTLILCLLFTVACGVGTSRYHNTLDFRFFFSADNPQLAAYEDLQSTYGSEEFVFIAIATNDGSHLFSEHNLQALAQLTAAAWQTPYSLRVDSLTNFPYTLANEDDFLVEDLFSSDANLSQAHLQQREQFALREPATVNALISAQGDVAGMRILIKLPGVDRALETPKVVFFVRDLLARFEQDHPQFNTYLTGQIVVDQAFPESTAGDMAFVWPAFFVVMLVLLGLIFRSVAFVVFTVLTAVCAIGTGMGLLGWTGMKINAAVTVAPIMILTLAIADSVHILTRYRLFRQQGQDKVTALGTSLYQNQVPVLLTSVFTAAGFLTLHFNDSPPYQALGYIVCAGVIAAWLYATLLLPALVMIAPHRIRQQTLKQAGAAAGMDAVADWVIRHPRALFAGGLVVVIAGLACLPLNRINDDPVKYFGTQQTMRQHMEFVNDRITGLGALNFSIPVAAGQPVTHPDYLNLLDQFSQWLAQQPHVVHVDSMADIIKRLNQSWHSDDADFYQVPNDPEAIAQLLLLYEMSLPFGGDLSTMIAPGRQASRVRVTMNNTAGEYHIELNQKAFSWLQQHAKRQPQIISASAPLMFAHIGERSMKGMLIGLIGSLFVMGLVLSRLFRSVKLGLVSIACNVLPVALAFGVWGMLNGNIDVGLTVTLGIAFGIVVDDTIHFLGKYRTGRQQLNMNSEDAVRFAFARVGPAILITSLILIAGFAMLGFSAMNITANTSILTTLTIGIALLVDLLFIPALLLIFDRTDHNHHSEDPVHG